MPLPEAREHERILSPVHPERPALPEHASPSSPGLSTDAAGPYGGLNSGPGKRSWLRIVLICLFLAAAVAFVVYRIRTNKAADQKQAGAAAASANRPIPVAFNSVLQRPVPIYLTALGTVTAYNTVTVKSRVDGQITKINFQEGQHVTQGQLLVEIDPRPYQATLAQAQGNFVRDQANAAFAQAQAQRYNQLYTAGVVSKESTQTQEATAGQASGTMTADQAAIQSARVNLNYTHITSPISGIAGLRQVDIGNVIAANSSTGLLVITQVEPIAVIFTLPEDQLPEVFTHMKGGRKLTVEAWDRGDQTRIATGELLTVDNQIDTTTGTAKLKAVFQNHDGALFPNQFVNIRLVLENRPDAITVPAAAIQSGNGHAFVYVIDMQHPVAPDQTSSTPGRSAANGGRGTESSGAGGGGARSAGGTGGPRQTSYPVHPRPVSVYLTQGTTVVISSGLQPGEKVVTDGQEKLKDGSKVIPHPAAQVDGPAPNNGSARAPDGDNSRSRQVPVKGTPRTRHLAGAGASSTETNATGSQSNGQGTNTGPQP